MNNRLRRCFWIMLLVISSQTWMNAFADPAESFPPIRALTSGPAFHWFGYYDKLEFDPTSRYVLGMQVNFEGRSPEKNDIIKIGMIDTHDKDRWIELGQSSAWGWQQGCMLQWIPGSKTEVIWNDRDENGYVSRVMNVFTKETHTIPHAIYSLSPDGKTAVTADFRRIQDMRPGYGYAGFSDPHAASTAPQNSGIWHVNLQTGKANLIISLADIAAIPYDQGKPGEMENSKHWFNHLLVNTDGTRFIFLHRWRITTGEGDYKNVGGFGTRMFTANVDGSDIRLIDPYGKTSHFIWRDPNTILAWAWHPSHQSRFYLYEDREGGNVDVIGKDVMTVNGHCTYLPGNQWILNDTYPDKNRNQNPYLYHVDTGKRIPLGHFFLDPKYKGEWRCDLHPRFSPDGKKVVIDSPHGGNGRQLYLIDIRNLVE
jgi:hypothetical protein